VEAEAARIYNLAFAENEKFYEFVQHLDTLKKIFKEGDTIVVPLDWDLTKVLYGEDAESK
jgi:regulator of protease activity HflC (stomatin/prohibitin superfamily)